MTCYLIHDCLQLGEDNESFSNHEQIENKTLTSVKQDSKIESDTLISKPIDTDEPVNVVKKSEVPPTEVYRAQSSDNDMILSSLLALAVDGDVKGIQQLRTENSGMNLGDCDKVIIGLLKIRIYTKSI